MKLHTQTSKQKGKNSPSKLIVTTPLQTTFDSRWSQIKISDKNISGRSNHVAVSLSDRIYIHGGYSIDQGTLSDFYCIDLRDTNLEFCWKKLNNVVRKISDSNQTSLQTLKLKGHSGIQYKMGLLIFGGQKCMGQNSNEVFWYDIQKDSWKKIQTKNSSIIPKVDSHCVAVIDSNMYVYGGYNSDSASFMKNIYCLNLPSMEWKLIYQNNTQPQQQHSTQNKTQILTEPQPRSNLAMVSYKQSLWIFGGTNGKKTLNDMWKFDTKLNKWQKIQSKNVPQARRGHSMIVFKNMIFLFGGIQDVTKQKNDVYVYEFETNTWSKIHNYTNSIYECSPTLKKSKKQASKQSFQYHSIQRSSPLKSSYSGDALMNRIMAQNKQKKFLEKKKQLFQQFTQKQQQYKLTRRISPTTQSMMKSLQSIGHQQDKGNPYHKQIIYDESHRFIIGKKPCARDGHSITLSGDKMYIFGGDRHLMSFNDLYMFELEKGIQSLELYRTK